MFGIARTTAAVASVSDSDRMLRPAMMEITSASPTRAASDGSTASAICGLMASTTTSGRNPSGIASVDAISQSPARPASVSAGSTMTEGANPPARQPASIAPPIRPQPSSRIAGSDKA